MGYLLKKIIKIQEKIYSVFYLNQERIKINIYIKKFFKELDHFYINCLPKT